jgi:lipoprotein-anchoring transpeptidase ErfK/SrfK
VSNRLFHPGPLGLVTLIALCLAAPAAARDRGVRVAPDLADEWILQLSPGSGVVPGYVRPDLAHPRLDAEGVAYQRGRTYRPADGPRYRPRQQRLVIDARTTGSILATPAAGAAIAAPAGAALVAAAPAGKPRAMKRVDSIDPVFLPQLVDYPSDKPAGTVVIDTNQRFLYLVEGGGKARRYGVGVGKPGFSWAGSHTVTRKSQWPTWTPPAQMRAREAKKGKARPSTASTAPTSPGRSARPSPPAASACATRTSPTSTSASPSAPR